MRSNRVIAAILLAAIAWLVASCSTSPTGRRQLTVFSEEKMEKMGAQSFAQIKAQTPPSRDADAIRIVNCVANAIVERLPAEQRGNGWEVWVFDGNMVNAFALPGRKIGVYEGIFRAARNQDQLAAVIGHEVAHVTSHHANERVSTSSTVQNMVGLAQAAAGGSQTASGQIAGLLGAGAQVGVILPFNRKQESEADVVGMDYMAKAGFDPRATIPLWENMAKIGNEKPPEFLSTHPSDETRKETLTERIPVAIEFYEEARSRGVRPDCGF
jgi:predicted Zn-dependent protease